MSDGDLGNFLKKDANAQATQSSKMSEGRDGNMHEAITQARRDGASAVNALCNFYERCFNIPDAEGVVPPVTPDTSRPLLAPSATSISLQMLCCFQEYLGKSISGCSTEPGKTPADEATSKILADEATYKKSTDAHRSRLELHRTAPGTMKQYRLVSTRARLESSNSLFDEPCSSLTCCSHDSGSLPSTRYWRKRL